MGDKAIRNFKLVYFSDFFIILNGDRISILFNNRKIPRNDCLNNIKKIRIHKTNIKPFNFKVNYQSIEKEMSTSPIMKVKSV